MHARAKDEESIFCEALECPSTEAQAAYLEEVCRGDGDLRHRVEALLRARSAHASFLAQPAVLGGVPMADSPQPGVDASGTAIGPYRLLERIGEGGFGSVYMAEQSEPVQRRVALKVIKPGMDSSQVIARFEAERQALAMMDHPNIARVLDAGATDAQSALGPGRPYFAMELVRGIPITTFCDEGNLAIRQRLGLFTDVCHAVQHAHQKGVIHRDIKPTNVLVTVNDDKPVPKVIDFGVAKATHGRLTDKTLFTEFRQLIGTPVYMSPEQAQMSGIDVDTRSDIYSLGVLLYELLTGTTPFDSRSLFGGGFDEMRRIMREVEPPSPSTSVAAAARGHRRNGISAPPDEGAGPRHDSAQAARQRATDQRSLCSQLRGELDWIVMKCLEKDRTRRYETASGLAADVQHFLSGEPVVAAPPSARYRVMKAVRRHRVGVIAVLSVMAALLLGTIGTGIGFMRERQQRELAEKREKETRQVSDFQAAMLREIDVEAMGRGIKDRLREQVRGELERQYVAEFPNRRPRTREEIEAEMAAFDQRANAVEPVDTARWVMDEFVLSRAAGALEKEFADQPLLRAQLHSAIGTTYTDLGLDSAAEPHLRTALEIRKRELGAEHALVADSLKALGMLLLLKPDFAAAEPLVREGLALERRIHGEESPQVAECLNMLARVLEKGKGDLNEAERLYHDLLARRRRLFGNEHPEVAAAMHNLALFLLESRGDDASAEPLFQEALTIARKAHGNEHLSVAQALASYASLLMKRGDYARAEPLYREALAIRRSLRGDEHAAVADALKDLAHAIGRQGDWSAAEPLYHELLALRRKLLGDEHPSVAWSLDYLATALFEQGDYAAVEPLNREALAIRRKRLGDENPLVARSLDNLGQVLRHRGDSAAAEALLREALAMRRKVLGDAHPDVVRSLEVLAVLLHLKGEHATCEALYREALALARELPGAHRDLCARVLYELAATLRLHGKPAEALPLARESVALHQQQIPAQERDEHSRDDEHARALEELAEVHHALGQFAEGVAVLREALVIRRERRDDLALAFALSTLGRRLVEQNKYAEAEPVLREAMEGHSRVLGGEHPDTLMAINNLGALFMRQGRLNEALPLFGAGVRTARAALGRHPTTALLDRQYAEVLLELGRLDEAIEPAQASVEQHRAHPDWAPGEAVRARGVLGAVLRAAGRQSEAMAVTWESVQATRARPGTTPVILATALATYGRDAIAVADQASLESAEEALRECLAIREKALGPDSPLYWQVANARSMLGAALAGQGAALAGSDSSAAAAKFVEAEPLLIEAARWFSRNPDRTPAQRAERARAALARVIRLYESWETVAPGSGKADRAAEWRAELEKLSGP
jgi:serine/threonine protein kinase/tetratricopeptide (TPR) repeat protein